MTNGGPADWMGRHEGVRLRPVEERDLGLLERGSIDLALSEPFEWHGYRDPTVHRRRWEQDRYLGQQDSMLVVALPDRDRAFAGFVVWRAVALAGPVVCYNIGILLLPERRGQGLGSAAQCLLAEHLFSTTLANRVETVPRRRTSPNNAPWKKPGSRRRACTVVVVSATGGWLTA
ncbi:MAG TPA: GNAT family protein [Acidimicrobiales bacterium]|nr:GNAT family protein [Acidimicrobiales bacterium]